MHALAVAAQYVLRREAGERPRRDEAQKRMDAEHLAAGAEIADGAESVAAEQHALLLPPQRDLAPQPVPRDRNGVEGRARDALERRLVVRHAEPRGQGGRVAAVPVEELDHTGRLAELPDVLLHPRRVDRIEDPDASLRA